MDKKSREQFERRTHKRSIVTPPLSPWELSWVLDAVKSYDFPGVQIELAITSRTPIGRIAGRHRNSQADPGFVLKDHLAKLAEQASE